MKVILTCVIGLMLSLTLITNTRAAPNVAIMTMNHVAAVAAINNTTESRVHKGVTKRAQDYINLKQLTEVFAGPIKNPCDPTVLVNMSGEVSYPCQPVIKMQ